MSVPSHFGRYRVLQPLATGEMGVVYLAEDPLIGRKVAIKGIRLSPETEDTEIRGLHARFEQEIQIAGTFTHPNIVMLFDVGRQDGYPFIAMEYVEGRNLRAELQATGPLPVDRVIELMAPVSRALSYAHERQVIHRDVKPTNILVSTEGIPKITDFGVARLYGSTLTRAGRIFGTPAYMSPEQTIGGNLTGASDQFAVATMAYELLTGERPFKGTSPTAVIYEVIEHHPPPPDELNPLIPAAVGKVIMRGLQKHPDERYESCDAFADALERAEQWSRAHPERAFLGDAPPATEEKEAFVPPPSADATSSGWTLAVRTRANALLEAAAATVAADYARSFWRRVPDRFRNAPTVLGAALMLVTLMLFAAWALPGGGSNADLLAPAGAETIANSPSAGRIKGTPPAEAAQTELPATGPGERPDGGATASLETELAGSAAGGAEPAGEDVAEAVALTITTRPRGARVRFDGEDLGDAARVSVSPGRRHTLRLELEGYETFNWAFSLDDLSERHLSSGNLHFPLTPLAEDTIDRPATAADFGAAQGIEPGINRRNDDADRATTEATSRTPEGTIPPTPREVRRLRAPQQTAPLTKISHVEPELPGSERGVVILEIEVSSRGNVVQAKLLRGMSRAANQAALDAVVRWKYEPRLVDGLPANVIMTVTLPINGG